MAQSKCKELASATEHVTPEEWRLLRFSLLHVMDNAGIKPNYIDCWDPAWDVLEVPEPSTSNLVDLAQCICRKNPDFLSQWPEDMVKALLKMSELNLDRYSRSTRNCRKAMPASLRTAFDAVKFTLVNMVDGIGNAEWSGVLWDETWNPRWLMEPRQ